MIRLLPRKCVRIAWSGEIAGIQFLYFNARDVRDSTIHEGWIAVPEEFRDRGIARRLRSHTRESLRGSPVKAVSSRISYGNVSSMRSAEAAGFRVRSRYRDANSGDERAYLWQDVGNSG